MHEINFILNGAPRRVIVDPQKSLLKVIREDLKLTGTKDSCSAGHCGTCAVLMDGEVVLSCRVPVPVCSASRVPEKTEDEIRPATIRMTAKVVFFIKPPYLLIRCVR